MDIILWRHADAVTSEEDDCLRKLTGKGRRQAAQIVAWLDRHLPDGAKTVSSPVIRARETAEALAQKYNRKLTINPELGPGAAPVQLLIAAGWPDNRHPVVIVGHQPALGRLGSFLLFGEEQNTTIRKASVWWLTNRAREDLGESKEAYPVSLRAAVCPDFL